MTIIDQILKHAYIQKRTDCIKNFESEGDIDANPNLLQTIRIPKNLLILTERLPQKNYNTKEFPINNLTGKNQQSNFPDILSRKTKNKQGKRDNGELSIEQEAFFTQEDAGVVNRIGRKKKPKDLNLELAPDGNIRDGTKEKEKDVRYKIDSLINAKPTITLENKPDNKYDKYEEKKSPINQKIKIKPYQVVDIRENREIPRNDSVAVNLPNIHLGDILDKKPEHNDRNPDRKVDKNDYYSVEK